jgi:hypothetical protein
VGQPTLRRYDRGLFESSAPATRQPRNKNKIQPEKTPQLVLWLSPHKRARDIILCGKAVTAEQYIDYWLICPRDFWLTHFCTLQTLGPKHCLAPRTLWLPSRTFSPSKRDPGHVFLTNSHARPTFAISVISQTQIEFVRILFQCACRTLREAADI